MTSKLVIESALEEAKKEYEKVAGEAPHAEAIESAIEWAYITMIINRSKGAVTSQKLTKMALMERVLQLESELEAKREVIAKFEGGRADEFHAERVVLANAVTLFDMKESLEWKRKATALEELFKAVRNWEAILTTG